MKDTLIKFKTAKFANSKGFPGIKDFPKTKKHYKLANLNLTQTSLQKWLREKRDICVESVYIGGLTHATSWFDFVVISSAYTEMEGELGPDYETYEKALEAGMFEALKTLEDA